MSFLLRNRPQLHQRLFTSSSRRTNLLSIHPIATAHLSPPATTVPRLGRVARWYLPTMAAVALGIMYLPKNLVSPTSSASRATVTLPVATANIGLGVTNALHEANRKAGMQSTQEQRNLALMDAYGERNSLEDMERALAGLDANHQAPKDRNGRLEEAYGARETVRDLERAMKMYEVQ